MKKFVAFLLIVILCANIVNSVYANTERISPEKILVIPCIPLGKTISIPVGNAEYIDVGKGSLIKISDLLTFSDQNGADSFIRGLKDAIANPTQHNPTLEFGMRTTHGNVRVASITYNYSSHHICGENQYG